MATDFTEFQGRPIMVFPLAEGKINVTSTDGVSSDGVFAEVKHFYCVADGQLTITYSNGNDETQAFVEGNCFGIPNAASIEIVSGTFHLA